MTQPTNISSISISPTDYGDHHIHHQTPCNHMTSGSRHHRQCRESYVDVVLYKLRCVTVVNRNCFVCVLNCVDTSWPCSERTCTCIVCTRLCCVIALVHCNTYEGHSISFQVDGEITLHVFWNTCNTNPWCTWCMNRYLYVHNTCTSANV